MIARLLNKLQSPRVQSFIVYMGSTFIAKLIPFIALPFVTKLLGPEEYGKWALYSALLAFALPLAGNTMAIQITRRYYLEHESDRTVILQQTVLLTILCAIALFVLLLPTLFFETIFSLPTVMLLTLPLLVFLQNMVALSTKLLRFENRPFAFAGFEIGGDALNALLYVTLIVLVSYSWKWFVVGGITSAAVFSVISIIHLHKSYGLNGLKIDKSHMKDILTLALPMIPHLVGASLIVMTDRIVIERIMSVEAVGVYAVAMTIAGAHRLFIQTVLKVWSPWLTEQLSHLNEARKKAIVRNSYVMAGASAGIAFAMWAAGSVYIYYFFDARFHVALTILPWAFLSLAIQGCYHLLSQHIIFSGKTTVLMRTTFTVGLFNLALTILFVHWFGLVGAQIASAISFTIQLSVIFSYIQNHTPIKFFGAGEEEKSA